MTEQSESGAGPAAVGAIRDVLSEAVGPVDRTETLPVGTAVRRPLAEAVTARRPLPHYDRVTVDGFALRAADTERATPENPIRFAVPDAPTATHDTTTADPESPTAIPVDAGAQLPENADAVVATARAETSAPDLRSVNDPGEAITVRRAVEPGDGARREGADFAAGETVLPAGRRIRPSDPALCVAVGRTRVETRQRPAVGIVPTGERLVGGAPEAGDVVETDGRTLSALVERWGGKVTYRDAVDTDPHALRAAVERDLTKDLLVTTGGTGAGSTDRIYDVLDGLGTVGVRGAALDPGGTTGFAVVRERPVVVLPGDPVGCLVAAHTFLRPAVGRLAGRGEPSTPTTSGRLAAAIESERGVRTVVPVAVQPGGGDDAGPEQTVEPLATPATATQATVARADGWLVVPADTERRAAGETVTVADWETPI